MTDSGLPTSPESGDINMFTGLLRFLEAAGVSYEVVESGHAARLDMTLDNAKFSAMFLLGENNFISVTVTAFRTPKSRRSRVHDILNRINYDLAFGNFEMDSVDGEIRFRTGYPLLKKEPLPDELWSPFVFMGFGMMNRFWPAIQSVCWTNISAEQALEDALEQQRTEEKWGGLLPPLPGEGDES